MRALVGFGVNINVLRMLNSAMNVPGRSDQNILHISCSLLSKQQYVSRKGALSHHKKPWIILHSSIMYRQGI